MAYKKSAFTIVELLIVIVVIGILAAITIVSYVGIAQRANAATVQSDLSNAIKQIEMFQITNSDYPSTISTDCSTNPDTSTNKCLSATSGVVYTYNQSPTNNNIFCLTAKKDSVSYNIAKEGQILAGPCPVFNLDAGSILSYPGSGDIWYDLSGGDDDGTLYSDASYSYGGGGSMSFDGVDDNVSTSIPIYGNNMTWEAWARCAGSVNTYNMFMGRHLPYFGFYSGNSIVFSNYIGGVQRTIFAWAGVTLNTWYHLVFTTEYDGVNTTAKIYINSNLSSSGTWAGSQGNFNYAFTVGDGHPTTWYPFKGDVSSVKIYNETLSESDISNNFEKTRDRYGL